MATDAAETIVTEVVEEKVAEEKREEEEEEELDQPPKRWWSPELLAAGAVCFLFALVVSIAPLGSWRPVFAAVWAGLHLIGDALTIRRGAPTLRYTHFVEHQIAFTVISILITLVRLF